MSMNLCLTALSILCSLTSTHSKHALPTSFLCLEQISKPQTQLRKQRSREQGPKRHIVYVASEIQSNTYAGSRQAVWDRSSCRLSRLLRIILFMSKPPTETPPPRPTAIVGVSGQLSVPSLRYPVTAPLNWKNQPSPCI